MTSRGPAAKATPRRRRTHISRPRHPTRSPARACGAAVYHAVHPVTVRYSGYAIRFARRLRRERVMLGVGTTLALAVLLTVLTTNAQGTPSSRDVLRKLPAYSLVYPGGTLLKLTEATTYSHNASIVTVTRVFGLPRTGTDGAKPLDVITWYNARLERGGWQSVTEQTNGITDAPFAWATACDHFVLLVKDSSALAPNEVAGLDPSGYSLIFTITIDQGCLPQS